MEPVRINIFPLKSTFCTRPHVANCALKTETATYRSRLAIVAGGVGLYLQGAGECHRCLIATLIVH